MKNKLQQNQSYFYVFTHKTIEFRTHKDISSFIYRHIKQYLRQYAFPNFKFI